MKEVFKYIFAILGVSFAIYILWYFIAIVSFIVAAAVLSLVTRPLFDIFKRLSIRGKKLSSGLSALFSVIIVWSIMFSFIGFSIPFIFTEVQFLSKVDLGLVIDKVEQNFGDFFNPFANTYIGKASLPQLKLELKSILISFIDFSQLKFLLASIAEFLSGTFIAAFSISFMTFFFLKDDRLLIEGVLIFTPASYEVGLNHVFNSVKRLLRRYFVGVIIQVILVGLFVFIGFSLLGVGFQHAVTIGLIAGLFNIIPYLGPLMGGAFGIFVGTIIYFNAPWNITYPEFLGGICFVFILVQILDNILFQPIIFSSSVKAHPLEIFIVILMSGYLSGIPGMFLAIPVYTIIRVVAHEFFFNYKLVKRLTNKLG